ncbi:MAG TPA: thymidylate synthase, partial [Verrucomicrobiae bacterium]|nr:thymidylate synthase [Verrucomicrobiae bacterium]
MKEEFTAKEQSALAPFFTNLTDPVFGLKLPQEVAGALFSRYSRSSKSLRRTFLDEFLGDPELALEDLLGGARPSGDKSAALAKARAFYDRVLVGYGDDSVAQLGAAHLACENISNVAANILEDARIGIAPLEKSTRYVRFDQKDAAGDYLFYREPKIMASRHQGEYLAVMNLLFETYSREIDPMIEFVKRSLPIEAVELRHPESGAPLSYRDAQKDEKLKKWAETAYRSTIRTQACDILRGYLPAATLTNVGFFGVGQAFEYLLTKLYSSELSEMQERARAMHRELNDLIPSFVKRAKRSEYLAETYAATRAAAERLAGTAAASSAEPVALVAFDERAEEKTLAAILYPHTRRPLGELENLAAKLSPQERERVFADYFGRRRHRRDKPGRARA